MWELILAGVCWVIIWSGALNALKGRKETTTETRSVEIPIDDTSDADWAIKGWFKR